jgi:hypothetical protein
MALQNCTINSSSVLVTPSQALGSGVANQVLTITPNTGYRVDASLFTNNSGVLTGVNNFTGSAGSPALSYVNGIALSNSGTGYAEDNTVLVTIDLDDSFNPGTTDQTITIDIDGKAILEKDIPKTLSGEYTVNAAAANMSPVDGAVEDVTYTGTAETGTTVDLFTQAVTASTGYYFPTEPTLKILSGDVNNYSVTKTLGYDGSNNLNSVTFDVDGIIPLENDTNDQISITATDVATVPVAANNITAYSINTDDAPYALTKRALIVYGTVGAKYTINITRTGDSHTYDFSTKDFTSASTNSGTLTIASNGQKSTLIDLPLVLADVTYTFTIAAVSPTTLSLNSSQVNPFTINRRGFKSITVNATSTDRGTFQSKVISYTNYNGDTITQSAGANATYGQSGSILDGSETNSSFNFNIVIDDDQAFTFSGSNALSNSVSLNSNHYSTSGNASINAGTTTATRAADGDGNSNQKLTIAGTDWYTNQFGTSNHVITFNIDEFCDPGSGGSNPLSIGTTSFEDITGGVSSILYPQGYIQQVSGRGSGSSTITYDFNDVELSAPDIPSYVDNGGDVTITATYDTGSSTKFNSATYTVSGENFTITNGGTSSVVMSVDFTVTVTSFGTVAASGDTLNLLVKFAFSNISQ